MPGTPRVVVIGVGNPERGDDALGLEVARALRSRAATDLVVEEAGGDLTSLLEMWEGRDLAILVDAMRSSQRPGTIARLELTRETSVPQGHRFSTHGISLLDAVGLGRSLGRMPGRLVLYGVEAASAEMGAPLSPAVREALPGLLQRVLREVDSPPPPVPRED